MAKKPDLGEALRHASSRAVPATLAAPPPATNLRLDRQGTKTIAGHFNPAAARQLKQLALDRESTVQELLREALNGLFQKQGLPPLA